MKCTLNTFGTDTLRQLQSDGTRMASVDRLFRYVGPAIPELQGKTGVAHPKEWKRGAAGLPIQFTDDGTELKFPEPIDITNWHLVTTDAAALGAAIAAVEHCIKQDGPRQYGNVVALQTDAVVGTDGYRLTWADIALAVPAVGLCIPAAVVPLVVRACKAQPIGVYRSEDDTSLAIVGADWQLVIRLSAVKYPGWRVVIPKKTEPLNGMPKLITEACTKAKLLRRAEQLYLPLPENAAPNHHFNAKFLRDFPDDPAANWSLGANNEDCPTLRCDLGNVHWIVVAAVKPHESTEGTK